MTSAAWNVAAGMLLLAGCAGCGEDPGRSLAPTRGYLLISIDTLRADHLGTYGYSLETSPFLDSLAARGVVFEHAMVQLPGTLPSHMSIFTGLYPAEHGVYPPAGVLSPEIETLPELFQRHGFRTGGFTESGYMAGSFGFARGFDEFDDTNLKRFDDVERTVARGLDFLARQPPEAHFFLFLHTYAVHDPYFPPEPYASRFGALPPAGAFPPTGPNFGAFNRGELAVSSAGLDFYRAAYDASIRYLDDVLRGFFEEIEKLGLGDDLTIVVTSDHGEEFLEHGKLAHDQTYRETMNVPLIVLHPEIVPRRVRGFVESIDVAPTLIDLAGLDPWERHTSGRSLVDHLLGADGADAAEAFGESADRRTRTLFHTAGDDLFQYLESDPELENGGKWVSRRLELDVFGDAVELSALSYHRQRRLDVEVDGERRESVLLEPDAWSEVTVELPAGGVKKRITLSSESCDVPRDLGESDDPRCLSFRVQGVSLKKVELYDIQRDPAQQEDLSFVAEGPLRQGARRLGSYELEPLAAAGTLDLDPKLEERLKGLGYLQ